MSDFDVIREQLDRIEAKLDGLRLPHEHTWQVRDLGTAGNRNVCSGCGVIGSRSGYEGTALVPAPTDQV